MADAQEIEKALKALSLKPPRDINTFAWLELAALSARRYHAQARSALLLAARNGEGGVAAKQKHDDYQRTLAGLRVARSAYSASKLAAIAAGAYHKALFVNTRLCKNVIWRNLPCDCDRKHLVQLPDGELYHGVWLCSQCFHAGRSADAYFYQRCADGENCRYAHGQDELRCLTPDELRFKALRPEWAARQLFPGM